MLGPNMEIDSQVWLNNSIYAGDSSIQKYGLATTNQRERHMRQQREQFEHEYKQRFYENLKDQMEKRINQINFQTNIYKKQKKLYSIYGGAVLNTSLNKEFSRELQISDSNFRQVPKGALEQFDRSSI
jgi:hypothetical protein